MELIRQIWWDKRRSDQISTFSPSILSLSIFCSTAQPGDEHDVLPAERKQLVCLVGCANCQHSLLIKFKLPFLAAGELYHFSGGISGENRRNLNSQFLSGDAKHQG